ncbi:hypothetical protein [Rhodohalobacter halophilus]|uniref:hypothetical protein n=1 Tax=Rhodohalobacter halophilus TaxID=1812810 RepID=UPI00083FA2F2|nr:hypothetical protein [Rhodohalobacter halophilus]
MQKKEIINREAADKSKGFRLQKLRAAKLALKTVDAITEYSKGKVYFATEYLGDVYINTHKGDEQIYVEEDKNYSSERNFSLNSPQIKNALVAFLDLWFDFNLSNNVRFGFYTTANISKEKETSFIKSLGLKLPNQALLESIKDVDSINSKTIELFKQIITHEYELQYSSKSNQGNLGGIKKLSDDDWAKFCSLINWEFGQEDHKSLEIELIDIIKESKFYSSSQHAGKEEIIRSMILESLDSSQANDIKALRVLGEVDLKVVFLEVASLDHSHMPDDPVYKIWNDLTPSDSRNLKEKIREVTTVFSEKRLSNYAITVSRSLIESQKLETHNNFIAMRFRIYEHCNRTLLRWLNDHPNDIYTEKEIDELNDYLITSCVNYIEGLKSDFNYSFSSRAVIEGVIIQLFDTCYLSYEN